ncbi:hypothetical protein MPF19_02005 [Polaribacter sp. Z014]|uniref:hypothetical protein n=1 Tax=unclassified Polaribacter TaxID=196858 RepID=UPI00193C28BB|nr:MULTISPECIES: hypothetical protein [unclassified Polaribacter]MCL7762172.1 hypothetical protein [Polaribacter sp. Z014]QVY64401.1 hypothetical protein JOP69_11540 [Polaribacter sp. Q13]
MKILSILAIIFSFSQCGSTQFVKNVPFTIKTADYMHWSGGQPGVSGINVLIELKEKSNIEFDSLYFRKKVKKVEFKDGLLIVANYNTSKNNTRNLILHSDTRKELKNKIPKTDTFPFKLLESEAILTYQMDGKTKYYKIAGIKKRDSSAYPKIQ